MPRSGATRQVHVGRLVIACVALVVIVAGAILAAGAALVLVSWSPHRACSCSSPSSRSFVARVFDVRRLRRSLSTAAKRLAIFVARVFAPPNA